MPVSRAKKAARKAAVAGPAGTIRRMSHWSSSNRMREGVFGELDDAAACRRDPRHRWLHPQCLASAARYRRALIAMNERILP